MKIWKSVKKTWKTWKSVKYYFIWFYIIIYFLYYLKFYIYRVNSCQPVWIWLIWLVSQGRQRLLDLSHRWTWFSMRQLQVYAYGDILAVVDFFHTLFYTIFASRLHKHFFYVSGYFDIFDRMNHFLTRFKNIHFFKNTFRPRTLESGRSRLATGYVLGRLAVSRTFREASRSKSVFFWKCVFFEKVKNVKKCVFLKKFFFWKKYVFWKSVKTC